MYEYVPGQKVTLDTHTGHYWVWDLAHFYGTYADQMTTIAGLGTYGNIAGGWHMATESEMSDLGGLWEYDASEIAANFAPTWTPSIPTTGVEIQWNGRYDSAAPSPGDHCTLTVYVDSVTGDSFKDPLPGMPWPDDGPLGGAWVTTDGPVVPVPGAVVLAATGLLSSLLGVNRFRRKR